MRTKKLVFTNNKGGVGKTTMAYHCATSFAKKGYKTVLIDLDPQCNMSLLSLPDFQENTLFTSTQKTIHDVLKGVIEGGSDIDLEVPFIKIEENLSILPGSLKLSQYENLLITAFAQASSGEAIGYFQTSAIDRFLREKGLSEEIDIFIIDTSPNLGLLNRIIFLGADYFVVPMMPDAFSVQGIENLGTVFTNWKESWKRTGKAMSGEITSKSVLSGDGLFLGYIINSYNQYNQKPIKQHQKWIEQIPQKVKEYLSERHCRNGLVEQSWKAPVQVIKDYGQLSALAQDKNMAIFDLNPDEVQNKLKIGTRENILKASDEFQSLSSNLLELLEKY